MKEHAEEKATSGRSPLSGLVAALVLGFLGCGYGFYKQWEKIDSLERRLEVVDLLAVGQPVSKLRVAGFKPFQVHDITYDEKPCQLEIYRSSGTGGLESADFAVVIDQNQFIVLSFRYQPGVRQELLRSWGADL